MSIGFRTQRSADYNEAMLRSLHGLWTRPLLSSLVWSEMSVSLARYLALGGMIDSSWAGASVACSGSDGMADVARGRLQARSETLTAGRGVEMSPGARRRDICPSRSYAVSTSRSGGSIFGAWILRATDRARLQRAPDKWSGHATRRSPAQAPSIR
jgi:hypothetical protein